MTDEDIDTSDIPPLSEHFLLMRIYEYPLKYLVQMRKFINRRCHLFSGILLVFIPACTFEHSHPLQPEAKVYISVINKSQQALFIEKNKLTSSLEDLALGTPSETERYTYSMNLVNQSFVQTIAIPKNDTLNAYIGAVLVTKKQKPDLMTLSILCESDQPTKTMPSPITAVDGEAPKCPSGYHIVP